MRVIAAATEALAEAAAAAAAAADGAAAATATAKSCDAVMEHHNLRQKNSDAPSATGQLQQKRQ